MIAYCFIPAPSSSPFQNDVDPGKVRYLLLKLDTQNRSQYSKNYTSPLLAQIITFFSTLIVLRL